MAGMRWGIPFAVGLMTSCAVAQQVCPVSASIEGTVTDTTGAIVPAVVVRASYGAQTVSDQAGRFALRCAPPGPITVSVSAPGFAPRVLTVQTLPGQPFQLNVQLAVAQVRTDVRVSGTNSADGEDSGDSITLDTAQVQQLPDDPDDLLRELQTLASATGGDPSSTIVRVDGFLNSSALPPKSSIASIRISPDLFSSEYTFPPFGGGQVEITTKPGGSNLHGAVFVTDSNSVFNANDPLSVAATPAGKQRYGYELSGPIVRGKSGFALALEYRSIDEFNVVDAVSLDASGNQSPAQQSISAPQRLWIGSARGDWQITPNDAVNLSFSANVNNLSNQGVGGLTLAQAGYGSLVSEYDLRLLNTRTISASALNETRVGFTWKRSAETPNSTAPGLNVAGFFTGGGALAQNLNDRERDLEVDDDLLWTRGRQELKFGVQGLGLFVDDYDPSNFNGAYTFGGGSAPVLDANNQLTGQTTTVTALEQYRRALLSLPGGTPTTYQLTTGTPLVPLTQWRLGFYAQDQVKLTPQLTMNAGLRYDFLTQPDTYLNFGPRLGFAWALDKKQTWVIHLWGGLFPNTSVTELPALEVYRLNGVRQQEQTVYAPSYSSPLTPVVDSISVSTVDQFPSSPLEERTSALFLLEAEHDLPHHWHIDTGAFWGNDANTLRLVNINAPMVANTVGDAPNPTAALLAPRPFEPSRNIFQYQDSGHLDGDVVSVSVSQHSYKWFGLNARYGRQLFKTNAGDADLSPQSSYSNAGESARADWDKKNELSVIGNITLPYKIEYAAQFDARSGPPYNVVTGTDNNGDGDFNDRPSYASAPGPGVYSTPFGLLTTNTVNGNVPRNLGRMPALIYLDANLSRAFALNPSDKDHPRTVTFNARSANLLNHTNVTAVNTIVSSTTLGQPVAADSARRVELGARFSF